MGMDLEKQIRTLMGPNSSTVELINLPGKGLQSCRGLGILSTPPTIPGSFCFAVTLKGNVQNLEPVQNCTGSIFCSFHSFVRL